MKDRQWFSVFMCTLCPTTLILTAAIVYLEIFNVLLVSLFVTTTVISLTIIVDHLTGW